MSEYHYWMIDAFTRTPLAGNPAAVVFNADTLDGPTMQAIAREMAVSETVFLLAPRAAGADYRVRIFTPRSELPFAGHPTLAAAHAVTEAASLRGQPVRPRLLQECGLGLVPIEIEPDREFQGARRYTMTQGRPERRITSQGRESIAALLGVEPAAVLGGPIEVVSTGVPWLLVQLASRASLAAVIPDLASIADVSRRERCDGIVAFTLESPAIDVAVHVRTFAPLQGIVEDPVCGSGNGAVGAYLAASGTLADGGRYLAEQGVELGRPGHVYVEARRIADEWAIRIGGYAVRTIVGVLRF